MITGAIKNKVDKIWTDIWAGGIANPLTVIEQLTYLMFIRSLDEKELENEEFENMTGERCQKYFPSPLPDSPCVGVNSKMTILAEFLISCPSACFPPLRA